MSDASPTVVVDPESRRAVVLRPEQPCPQVLVHGFAGPPGVPISGASKIDVVETLPSNPDPNVIYITTT